MTIYSKNCRIQDSHECTINDKTKLLEFYTYKFCHDHALSLGLDLKGGMSLIMEISEDDVLRSLAYNSKNQLFNKAIENAKTIDVGLQSVFSKMKSESIKFIAELHNRVLQLGGEPQDGTTVSGKLYRAWMDIKATFTGKDRTSLLESCEAGEDAGSGRTAGVLLRGRAVWVRA